MKFGLDAFCGFNDFIGGEGFDVFLWVCDGNLRGVAKLWGAKLEQLLERCSKVGHFVRFPASITTIFAIEVRKWEMGGHLS